ncbi:MAG TPA: hybrid sensor histidine kinase/response regulator [Myxococcaceae bacterium]|nr:hybrid sensor histidine kinase/response regulator [Myxococcaceae bacterium]
MKKVLLADDEEALLEVLTDIVSGLGHTALAAHNGEEALVMARTELPDLIVSDQMMPRRTGVEFLRAIRADPRLASTPFILMSAAQPRDALEADRFLAKPVGLAQFETAVEEALRRAPPVPAGSAVASEASFNLAREEMLAWVAHEVKTPLSSARMHAELLLRRFSAPEDVRDRRRAESLVRQLDRMTGLVNSVLDAAKLAEGRLMLQRTRVDLRELLPLVVANWRDTQPDYQFDLYLPVEAPVESDLDPERFRQVLDNLLSNAVKYGLPSKRVEVALTALPQSASVQVTDYGPGIERHELPHIFDRFYRAPGSEGEGHGLGLYIAAALARVHGGSLEVDSQRGQGTSFTVKLPRSA